MGKIYAKDHQNTPLRTSATLPAPQVLIFSYSAHASIGPIYGRVSNYVVYFTS